MENYTTIRKKIKEFDVLISDNPDEFNEIEMPDRYTKSNLLRVLCRTDKYYATFLMSKQMLKAPEECDKFIYNNLTRQFIKLSTQ